MYCHTWQPAVWYYGTWLERKQHWADTRSTERISYLKSDKVVRLNIRWRPSVWWNLNATILKFHQRSQRTQNIVEPPFIIYSSLFTTSAEKKLELKIFYQTYTACKPPKSPLTETQWCRPLPLHAVCNERIPCVCCRGWRLVFCPWWPSPLTFDLDTQTRLSEDQTRLACKFGANPFSRSRDIWVKQNEWKNQRQR